MVFIKLIAQCAFDKKNITTNEMKMIKKPRCAFSGQTCKYHSPLAVYESDKGIHWPILAILLRPFDYF